LAGGIFIRVEEGPSFGMGRMYGSDVKVVDEPQARSGRSTGVEELHSLAYG